MQNKLNYLRALITKRLTNMEERGASAVEYGLLVAAIALAIILVVFTLGGKIQGLFQGVNDGIDNKGVTPAAGTDG